MTRAPAGIVSFCTAALLAAAAAAQDPPAATPAAPADPAALIARYSKLDRAKRSDLVRNLERRFAREDDDVLQSIVGRQKGRAAYPAPAERRWFEPREYAPVATPRSLVLANAPGHRDATAGMRPFVLLPELRAAVGYDWIAGKPALRGEHDLDDDQRVANLAHGYAPGSDHALAQVLQTLDTDADQRALADYFEHLYADRNGAVFAGVTLYDAWRSGRTQEMPDTDSIAFARLALDTRAYVAPLPEDRRRERLYEKISTAFASHHEHRTLCQALAATYIAADPVLEPAWQNLVERCHWLWQRCGRDPASLAKWLAERGGRGDVLREVDAARQTDAEPGRVHRQALVELGTWLRQSLDQELTRAGV